MNQQVIDLTADEAAPPRRSMRLATILPASHWISIGYSQADANAIEKLQNDMKKYCDGLDETKIELDVFSGSALPLQHHDMLLPHWKKLAKSLNGSTSINSIQIMGISLPVSVLDIIFPALQSMNLTKLSLGSVALGSDGFLKLSSFIKQNTSLVKLFLGGDILDDMSVASSFSDALKNHPNVGLLAFDGCGLSNPEIIEKILEGCKGVKTVAIMSEQLGLDGMTLMANFIRSSTITEILLLPDNGISDNDTVQLASALKGNTNLKQFDLRENDITEEGNKNMFRALYDPTSMDSIVESNHTCLTYTLSVDQRSRLQKEVAMINSCNDSIGQKIRKKVVLALCRQDRELFDLSHFNDLPLQLMPRVLALIQEHAMYRRIAVDFASKELEKDALSRLFHTLRGWELPLLFENLHNQSTGTGSKKKRRKTRR